MAAELVEASIPEASVVIEPGPRVLQGLGLEMARAPLGIAAVRDQARALQDLQVLGNGRQAHVVGRGQFADRRIPLRELCEQPAPGRVGKSEQGRAQRICSHVFNSLVDNLSVEYAKRPDYTSPSFQVSWGTGRRVGGRL